MKKIQTIALSVLLLPLLASCTDADTASYNLSKEADMFRINRRVVFYNGITGEYILEVQGLCSIGNDKSNKEMSITCKTGEKQYKKHFLGLSDNVTYFSEQIDAKNVSTNHYKVIFKPSLIIPDVEIK